MGHHLVDMLMGKSTMHWFSWAMKCFNLDKQGQLSPGNIKLQKLLLKKQLQYEILLSTLRWPRVSDFGFE